MLSNSSSRDGSLSPGREIASGIRLTKNRSRGLGGLSPNTSGSHSNLPRLDTSASTAPPPPPASPPQSAILGGYAVIPERSPSNNQGSIPTHSMHNSSPSVYLPPSVDAYSHYLAPSSQLAPPLYQPEVLITPDLLKDPTPKVSKRLKSSTLLASKAQALARPNNPLTSNSWEEKSRPDDNDELLGVDPPQFNQSIIRAMADDMSISNISPDEMGLIGTVNRLPSAKFAAQKPLREQLFRDSFVTEDMGETIKGSEFDGNPRIQSNNFMFKKNSITNYEEDDYHIFGRRAGIDRKLESRKEEIPTASTKHLEPMTAAQARQSNFSINSEMMFPFKTVPQEVKEPGFIPEENEDNELDRLAYQSKKTQEKRQARLMGTLAALAATSNESSRPSEKPQNKLKRTFSDFSEEPDLPKPVKKQQEPVPKPQPQRKEPTPPQEPPQLKSAIKKATRYDGPKPTPEKEVIPIDEMSNFGIFFMIISGYYRSVSTSIRRTLMYLGARVDQQRMLQAKRQQVMNSNMLNSEQSVEEIDKQISKIDRQNLLQFFLIFVIIALLIMNLLK